MSFRRRYMVEFREKGSRRVVQGFMRVGRASNDSQAKLERMRDVLLSLDSAMSIAGQAAEALNRSFEMIKAPVNLAVSFEHQFAMIRTLTDKVGADLETQLMDLAGRVPQTAADVADSAYKAISAGIDPSEVIGFLESASSAAVAGNATLTESTKALTGALNSYKESGLGSERAMDVLFATVQRGDTSFTELSESLGMVLPTAGQFGVSMEEVGASIATLTKKGMSTSNAIVRVNAVLKMLTSNSPQVISAFKNIEVKTGALELRSTGLVKKLKEIDAATKGNIGVLSSLSGNQEAMQGLLALTSEHLKGLNEDLEATTNSMGALSRASGIVGSVTQSAISQFEATGEGFLRALGTEILPSLNTALERITAEITENGPEIAQTLGGVVDTLMDLGIWVGRHGKTIATFFAASWGASKVSALALALNARLVPALARTGAAATGAGRLLGGMGRILSGALALTGPVGAAIGAASILGVAIAEAIGNSVEDELKLQQKRIQETLEEMVKDNAILLRQEFGISVKSGAHLKTLKRSRAEGKAAVLDGEAFTPESLVRAKGDEAQAYAEEWIEVQEARAKKIEDQARRINVTLRGVKRQEQMLPRGDQSDKAKKLRQKRGELKAEIDKTMAEAERERGGGLSFASNVDELLFGQEEAKTKDRRERAEEEALRSKQGNLQKAQQMQTEHNRLVAQLLKRSLDWRIDAIDDQHERELAKLEQRHKKEMSFLKRGGEELGEELIKFFGLRKDLEEKQQAERARLQEKWRAKERQEQEREEEQKRGWQSALKEREISLYQDESQQRSERLAIRHEAELELAQRHGYDSTRLLGVQAGEVALEREKTAQRFQEKERERWSKWGSGIREGAALAGGAVESVGDALTAMGIAGDLVAKAMAITRGAVAAADATSYIGESAAAFGRYDIWGGLKLAFAATQKSAAAVAYFAAAKGGGGSGGGGSSSGGGGGSAGSVSRSQSEASARRGLDSEERSGKTEINLSVNFRGQAFETRADIQDTVIEAVNRGLRRLGGARLDPDLRGI